MFRFIAVLALMLAAATSQAQSSAQPSEASIDELLTITKAASMLDGIWGQIDGMMKGAMQQALEGKDATPQQQAAIDKMRSDIMTIYREEMSWAKMRPIYVRIYQASFTQQEMDGMLAFYKSPSGQAMIKKMPLVLENTMTEMRSLMGPVMERVQASVREAQANVRATHAESNK